MNATEDQFVLFVRELIRQLDEGRRPTAGEIATGAGISPEDGRTIFASLAHDGHLVGLGTNEASVVRAVSVSADLREIIA